ncbi:hypothetical protein [Burkholderia ambifaria]|uniref:hypothetical protein n=1 Tax=Burkholderia ambifaria TaxID=152480 RepID=UPI0012FD70DF|nr:hypothetical protein [Burkholderia ambifaria]
MSNLTGRMRRLFANTARLPMDSCPVIRWASWIARASPLHPHPDRRARKRLGYETSGAGVTAFDRAADVGAARGAQPPAAAGRRRHTGVAAFRRSVDRNTQPVSTRRYVTSLKHFIRSGPDTRSIVTVRGVWSPLSIFHASQHRRDAMTAAAPRVNIARQSDRAAGTKPAFALQ